MEPPLEPCIEEAGATPYRNRTQMTSALLRRVLNLQRTLKNEYEWLSIPFTFTESKVKSAYRKAALRHHPDKGGTEEDVRKTNTYMEKIVNNLRTLQSVHPEAFI